MFEDRWKVSKAGVRYRKNHVYDMQDIKIVKKENIPDGLRPDRYAELVDSDFVGKLVIVYDKDNIGKSGGSPKWCYVYDCDRGNLTYKGTAIHKCVDLDITDQNYNEKVFSILGNMALDTDIVRIPHIDLVRNLEYPEDKPAVLSYNIVQRENEKEAEEMIMMETVAFNKYERQDIHDYRIPLNALLESVRIQVMKQVGYKKNSAKDKLSDRITQLKIYQRLHSDNEKYLEEEKLLTSIRDNIDGINKNSTINTFLKDVSAQLGREVTVEEVKGIDLNGVNLRQLLHDIKKISADKEENYEELEKSIIQTTVVDVLTNNIDRHLNNWSLIRDKKTDKYVLGLFDHAASFFNMGLTPENPFMREEYMKENWAPSSVLLDTPGDIKIRQSTGMNVFKYLMTNYREYTVEVLQKIYDRLPEFEKTIGFQSIPEAEYSKLPEEEKQEYYRSELDMPVKPKKLINNLKSKFRRIERDYDIEFSHQKVHN